MNPHLFENILYGNPIHIIDIGASGGLHRRWDNFSRFVYPILIEPNEEEYNRLVQKYPNGKVIKVALGKDQGRSKLHLTRKRNCSSVLVPNFDLLNKFPKAERFQVDRIVEVECASLDEVLKSNDVKDIDAIKLDTQGTEFEILQGANAALDTTLLVETEVEFLPMYVDQVTFCDLCKYMNAKGFELLDIQRVYWKRQSSFGLGTKGQLIDGDALFIRPPEYIVENFNETKIVHAICIFLIYGHDSLAGKIYDLAKDLLSQEVQENCKVLIRSFFKNSLQSKIGTFLAHFTDGNNTLNHVTGDEG